MFQSCFRLGYSMETAFIALIDNVWWSWDNAVPHCLCFLISQWLSIALSTVSFWLAVELEVGDTGYFCTFSYCLKSKWQLRPGGSSHRFILCTPSPFPELESPSDIYSCPHHFTTGLLQCTWGCFWRPPRSCSWFKMLHQFSVCPSVLAAMQTALVGC